MAQLAIKGHPKKGDEVIKRLEMLGGKNIHNYVGTSNECYAIDDNKICTIYTSVAKIDNCVIFTLEEFEEKFPYKVGDKVNYVKYNDTYPSVYTIQRMWWNGVTIEYLLDSSGFSALTKDLQPYKEENMEDIELKEITKKIANLLYKDKDVYNGIVYFDFSSYDYDEDIPSINVNGKKVLVSKFEINREGTIITIIGEHNTDRYTLDVNTCSEELFDEIYTLLNDVYSETDYSWEYGDFEDFLSKDINNKMKRFVFEYRQLHPPKGGCLSKGC